MRRIAILIAACIGLSSAAGAQTPPSTTLYKDEHWLLNLFNLDPLPMCMLTAMPAPKDGASPRFLIVYVDGKANIARIEVNNPPGQYLAPDNPTAIEVDLGPAFTRSIRFRRLLNSQYPIIAARLRLSDLEDIRLALSGAASDMSLRFENGDTWRFPPPQDRKLAAAAADCWKSAALADLSQSRHEKVMRCESGAGVCTDALPSDRPKFVFTNPVQRIIIYARAQYFYTLGNEYLHKEKYDRAIEYYDQAIRADASFRELFNQRGLAYLRSGRYDRAFDDFDQATWLAPTAAAPFGNRGLVYNQRRQYHLAIRDFDRAIRLNPNDWKFYEGRGNAKHAIGDIVGGDADRERASQLSRRR